MKFVYVAPRIPLATVYETPFPRPDAENFRIGCVYAPILGAI